MFMSVDKTFGVPITSCSYILCMSRGLLSQLFSWLFIKVAKLVPELDRWFPNQVFFQEWRGGVVFI